MDEFEFFEPNCRIELPDSFFYRLLHSKIVTCCEGVGGVEADSSALRIIQSFNYVLDILKRPPHAVPGSSCILEEKHDTIPRSFENLVDGVYDPFKTNMHPGSKMTPQMGN